MASNLDQYKADLDALIEKGKSLSLGMQAECQSEEVESLLRERLGDGDEASSVLAALASFTNEYQSWYSEAREVIKQIIPDRLEDFVQHYERPKNRKELSYESYRIADYLQGLTATFGTRRVAGPEAAIRHFQQQLSILKSAERRFESSLFDIRQLVQADLFDSELDAAEELAKKKFTRAAGAVAGVVLERHLAQVCDNHSVKLGRKKSTISNLNDALKDAGVIDTPRWRSIQHLGDLRNLCDHDKKREPTEEEAGELVAGVKKLTKTLF
jgi:hypothetical protein